MPKTFYTMDNIGKAKYTVSSHDGIETHNDGSPFYGIHTFSNKVKRNKHIKDLIKNGYTER